MADDHVSPPQGPVLQRASRRHVTAGTACTIALSRREVFGWNQWNHASEESVDVELTGTGSYDKRSPNALKHRIRIRII